MKAYRLKENGGIENLVLVNLPIPVLQPGEVLVKVKAIGINPVDSIVRRDRQRMLSMFGAETVNNILGWDISGTISDSGSESHSWKDKDVFGMVNFPGHGQAYAEYVAAPLNHLAVKPVNVTHEEAAGATLAALTAWQALVTYAQVHKGDHVLIHAAAGGVGHYAVQIAHFFGSRVTGTASATNKEFVLSLGAEEFIDYRSQKFEDVAGDVDVILDSIEDRHHLIRSVNTLKKGGRLVSIKVFPDDEIQSLLDQKNITAHRILVKSSGNDMKHIAELMQKGALKSHISSVFNFNELPEAHRQIETRTTRGKIVVTA